MLELKNISKSFPGVKALDNVSISIRSGEIHALVGENGAGKSTLIKIITGIYQADEGSIEMDEKALHFKHFSNSQEAGIGIVHQELQVFSDATVAENIMIDKLDSFSKLGVIDWKQLYSTAKIYMDRVGLLVKPGTAVRHLSAAQKQLIQIARALAAKVKVLLLDEPTSCLTEHEANRLFELLKQLREDGVALLFVSHKFEEIFAICDTATVLRDGKLVGEKKISDLTSQDLVKMMIGRACSEEHVGVYNVDENYEMLRVENLHRAEKCHGCNFSLYRGEVLGFYGLVGSGRTELARLIIGEDRPDEGHIFINGKKAVVRSVSESLYKHSISYVSENRKEDGLFLESSVRENLTITIWQRLVNKLTHSIDLLQEAKVADQFVKRFNIKTPKLSQTVNNLSGGNQQKVSIAKSLAGDADIVIIDEPTVGVDIGAKEQIHQTIYDLATKEKKAVIVISSDMPEIARVASRILVFRDLKIVGEVKDVSTEPKSYEQVSHEIGVHLQ